MCRHLMSSMCEDLVSDRYYTYCRKLLVLLIFSLQPHFSFSDFTVDQQFCLDPGVPEHGNRIPSSGVFFENALARFSCLGGFRLKGPSKMVCMQMQNGSVVWNPNVKPVCLHDDCLVPYVEDANVFNKTYRPGDKLIIGCNEGFQIRYLDMDTMQSVCQDDGAWSNLPICQGCLRPTAPSHSYVNISEMEFSVPVGTVVHYQCFPGYKLDGPELLECMHSLIWSDAPPRCLEVEVCPLPPMVEHGDYDCHPQPCDGYIHGTVVEFYCDPGYSLANDYRYITCQYGQWFPHIQVYCVKAEPSWPNSQEPLTTWKMVVFTAATVLLALFLVILAKVFQFRCKFQCHLRNQQQDSSCPNFLVVNGIPVLLPSYDEAVSSNINIPPSSPHHTGLGDLIHPEDQGPPAYPGHMQNLGGAPCNLREYETCESLSGGSENPQSVRHSSVCLGGLSNLSEMTNVVPSTTDAASTSPSIDITDEMPLVEEGAEDC